MTMRPDSLSWKMLEFYGTRIRHRGKWWVHSRVRSLLDATYDGDLDVERGGLRWRLNPSDFVQTHLYWTGEYEPWDLLHFSRHARPGAVVFDIGANFGFYSIQVASAIEGGQVFAFEPCGETFSRLQANIALNHLESRITAVKLGLSNHPGPMRLETVPGNSGATCLSLRGQGEPIPLDTLDHFCETQKIRRIDLMKIDVEGHELAVLQGGGAVISKYKPVMMIEFNREALEKSGASVERLSARLRDLGYGLFIAQRERLLPMQPFTQNLAVVNAFCIPREQARELVSSVAAADVPA